MELIMTLLDEYYEMVVNRIKSIEYRLLDEKRRKIKIGDIIAFRKASNHDEFILVKVIDLKIYRNLLEMYTATFDKDFKYRYESPQAVVDDTTYYSEEDRLSHPAVAIYFEVINPD